MHRFVALVASSLLAAAVCEAQDFNSVFATVTAQQTLVAADMEPNDVVNDQFAALPPISYVSSSTAVADWLVGIDEIFARVATGGLTSLPPNGVLAVKTMASDISKIPALLSDTVVLKRLLHVLPSLWDVGFWYRPVSEWKTEFGAIYSNAVTAAKTSPDETCYDAAINATSLMIRFIKDQVFLDGVDHGESVPLQGQNKDYLEYLPQLVTLLSKRDGFTLTESQLRTFMATKMPSKTEGMNTAAAFPVFVDTSKYKASDAAALDKLLCSG